MKDKAVSGTLSGGKIYDATAGFDETSYKLVSIMSVLSFKKIDSDGEALENAEFTLYEDAACTKELKDDKGKVVKAISKKEAENSDAIILFGSALPKDSTYYMKETGDLGDAYQKNEAIYKISYVVDAAKPENTGFKVEVKDKGETVFNPYPDNGNTIINIFAMTRKAILRKVLSKDDKYESLSGARFTLYYADRMTEVRLDAAVKDADGITTKVFKNLKSEANGIIWIGMLPKGKYYLKETTVPSVVTNKDKVWFVINVTEDGVEQPSTAYTEAEIKDH